jgi:hypothetical protein
MSEFKTNKISPRSGTTQTIGDSGDSVSTSSGSTINNAGTITTAGITGGTINNTTGSIYLRGEVDWQPSDIKTASFTATDNQGFFVNTTSGEITVTLPASPSAGDVVGIKDYANTFDTNKCILNANGNKIQGSTELFEITIEGSSIILIYVDATQGWVITDASKAADISQQALFTVATGGTITTSGDFKIHTFTGPGTLCISQVGNCVGGPGNVDYLVVAGGASGGSHYAGGGGGAGGYRTSFPSPGCNAGAFPISATTYPITVGGGGASRAGCASPKIGNAGTNSVFSTITSTGGGYGGSIPNTAGGPGGSGGGGGERNNTAGGAGNTPPVSPPQGNNGGNAKPQGPGAAAAGGGGGANAVGAAGVGPPSTGPQVGGNGGAGAPNAISGSATSYAGGGGGGVEGSGSGTPVVGGTGGAGGGGAGGADSAGTAGTVNTGGGGGGAGSGPNPTTASGAGGSGIVIIRYKFQ